MNNRKYILTLLLCLVRLFVSAQASIDIGAIVENDSFVWTLKTIERYSDSLVVKWNSKSKVDNAIALINNDAIFMKDYNTNTKIAPLIVVKPMVIRMAKSYETDSLRIVFPPIKDTLSLSLISCYLSPEIGIDSITLPYSDMNLLGPVRYRVPYIPKMLSTRIDSISFSDSLFARGISFYRKGFYQEAIICFEKCYAFDRLLDFEFLPLLIRSRRKYYDYSREWLAHCYYRISLEDRAKALDEDYMLEPIDRKLVEKSDSIYRMVKSLKYKPRSKDEEIIEYKKICELDSIALGTNHHRYALSLYYLGKAYLSYRLFTKAKMVLQKSYDIITSLSIDNHLVKSILNELALLAYQEEDYLSAIRYLEQSLGSEGEVYQYSEESILSSNYSTLANYYLKAGNWEKALVILKNRLLYWKAQDQNNTWNKWSYVSSLSSYASILSNTGRHKEALRVYSQLEKPDLSILGTYYYDLGDYQKASRCYLEILNDSISWRTNYDPLNSLAICYNSMGYNEKAIQIQKNCINKANPNLLTITNNRGFESYAQKLSNLASFFNYNEQYDSALVYERKSLELKMKYCSHGENIAYGEDIAYSYMNMGIAYGGKQDWEKAINYLLFGYEIYKKQRQKKLYHRILFYLSKYSYSICDIDNLSRYISEYIKSASEDLLSTFQELTYDERSRYIEEYSNILNQQIPMYAYYTHSISIIEAAYNASLMMKGALLNSENSVKRVIEESKDTSLKDFWEEMRADRYVLSKVLEKDSLYRKINTDSLQKIIHSLEDSIIIKCKKYDDITRSMKLKWQDIQKCLSLQDIAIEFMRISTHNDSIMYVALTLRKDSNVPKMIKLFEEKQLRQVSDTSYYQCRDMADLIWEPLRQELKGIKNIYFSPSGALYNIGIEYLPGMEDFNIYRLSSTRELITKNESRVDNKAVLYGGLDYYAQLDTLNVRKSLSGLDELFKERADVRGLKLRGGQGFLEHSKEEVEQISSELEHANWDYVLDTLSMGTEESFKALSGKKVGYLHISTHGFYYTKEEADDTGYKFFRVDNQYATEEDKSLTRSGLIMSGANHILEGKSIPDNVEDGILTAKEIADVDLRGLDLVVLSACQTGLGDISQSEGVFGLQRGFKKAGANTILMSLWEVDDKATQILMTQFYKNLLSGLSKWQSLLSAQNYLREIEDGKYNEPKYWAAFILLDGLK